MKIAFLGDSITHGSGTTDESRRFTNLLQAETGIECLNYGIGGTRIARQHTPSDNPVYDQDFVSRVPELDETADMVFVFGGTNDYGHGDAPLGTMADRTPETFYGALHCLYAALVERFPGKPVVVMTPLHRLNENNPAGEHGKSVPTTSLKGYVEIIREVAEYYSLPVLDLYARSGLQPAVPVIREKFVPDGLHPNDAGLVLLKDMICAFIKTLG